MAGLFICTLSLTGLIGYIPVIYIMIKAPSLKHPVYTLMSSLGVTDTACLVVWFTSGVFTLSRGRLIPKALMNWLMVIIEYGWYCLVCHAAVISLNRYVAVCRPNAHLNRGKEKGSPVAGTILLLGPAA